MPVFVAQNQFFYNPLFYSEFSSSSVLWEGKILIDKSGPEFLEQNPIVLVDGVPYIYTPGAPQLILGGLIYMAGSDPGFVDITINQSSGGFELLNFGMIPNFLDQFAIHSLNTGVITNTSIEVTFRNGLGGTALLWGTFGTTLKKSLLSLLGGGSNK